MPDKGLIYKFVAWDSEGKPPAPLGCSPKVDAYLSGFTIPQSRSQPHRFRKTWFVPSPKVDLLQNPDTSDKILRPVEKIENPSAFAMRHARCPGVTSRDWGLAPDLFLYSCVIITWGGTLEPQCPALPGPRSEDGVRHHPVFNLPDDTRVRPGSGATDLSHPLCIHMRGDVAQRLNDWPSAPGWTGAESQFFLLQTSTQAIPKLRT